MLFVFFFLLRWAPPGIGRLDIMFFPPELRHRLLSDRFALIAGDYRGRTLGRRAYGIAGAVHRDDFGSTDHQAYEGDRHGSVLSGDAVRYARASGLPAPIVRKIVLKNSSVPVMTFVGTEITGLVGTTSLIEYVFAWGGVGQFGLEAIVRGDFAVVQAYVLLLALFSVMVFLDHRHYGGRSRTSCGIALMAVALETSNRAFSLKGRLVGPDPPKPDGGLGHPDLGDASPSWRSQRTLGSCPTIRSTPMPI